MRLLLLSRGGSSRLFNHGDRIICIHCFKWLEITSPFRKCVSVMEQLSCEKIAHARTRTHDHTIVIFTTAASDHCALCDVFKLETLEKRRTRTDLVNFNKIITAKINCSYLLCQITFYIPIPQPRPRPSRNRRRDRLFSDDGRINIRKRSYFPRVMNSANNCHDIDFYEPSLARFKSALSAIEL